MNTYLRLPYGKCLPYNPELTPMFLEKGNASGLQGPRATKLARASPFIPVSER